MDIAKYIDHTLLKAGATDGKIGELCKEAYTHGFMAICVNPAYVQDCARLLKGFPGETWTRVCTVVGFPFGWNKADVKAHEARCAVDDGADEIDMVMNIGRLVSGHVMEVRKDIEAVRGAVDESIVLKVIIETSELTDDQKKLACEIAVMAGANFVKTSTGFATGGATVKDVALMRRVVGPDIGVKASGGIKDLATAKAMIDAGANRLGCSAGVAIVSEAHGAKEKKR